MKEDALIFDDEAKNKYKEDKNLIFWGLVDSEETFQLISHFKGKEFSYYKSCVYKYCFPIGFRVAVSEEDITHYIPIKTE